MWKSFQHAAILLLFVLCGGSASGGTTHRATPKKLSIEQIAAQTLPSVVQLVVRNNSGDIAKTGTGFVVGQNMIATNAHVVEGAHEVTARFHDNRSEEVYGIVGSDQKHDLVIVWAHTGSAKALKFAEWGGIAIGEQVIAIGNPQGLDGSVTLGIVSGLRDALGVKLIQTDASISPGSSGGPLLDEYGRVLGVTSFSFTDSQNLNFAYPITCVRKIIPRPIRRFLAWGESNWTATSGLNRTIGQLGVVTSRSTEIYDTKGNHGRLLSICVRGQYLSIYAKTEHFFAVLMIDKSFGYVNRSSVKLLDYQVIQDAPLKIDEPSEEARHNVQVDKNLILIGDHVSHSLVTTAKRYLNSNAKPFATDDGGDFIRTIFAANGINMPKTPEHQAAVGYDVPLNDMSQWIPGDRLYFACHHPRIDHTGMYIGNGLFIHAYGSGGHDVGATAVDEPFYQNHLVAVRRSAELLSEGGAGSSGRMDSAQAIALRLVTFVLPNARTSANAYP